MDDTNPTKEDVEYVDSITEDVNWLIAGWADDKLGLKPKGKTPETITSNGKPDFHLAPVDGDIRPPNARRRASSSRFTPPITSTRFTNTPSRSIKKGKAYVCDLTPDETDEYRRNAKESPFRNRSVEENLDLFTRMKNGEFPDGKRTLRAKIDVASPNIWMRDPAALPHPPRRASSHRRQMVHLPDVRLRALPERLHRRHHALASARWNSRCIARCTIGFWKTSICRVRCRINTNSPGSASATPS